jgi:hypothetical protein
MIIIPAKMWARGSSIEDTREVVSKIMNRQEHEIEMHYSEDCECSYCHD